MMEQLRQWLLGLMAVAFVLTLLYALLPAGAVRRVARSSGALVLLLALLGPLRGWDTSGLSPDLSALSRELDEQIAQYEQQNQTQLALGIQQRCAAYISEKAAQLNIRCQPQVETELREGIPCPSRVTLDVPKHQPLSELIEQDLGIPPESQFWLPDE